MTAEPIWRVRDNEWGPAVARAPGLSRSARRVAAVLQPMFNRQTGRCHPSHRYLAQELACSVRTVERGIAELCAAGFLVRTQRAISPGRSGGAAGRAAEYAMALLACANDPTEKNDPTARNDPTKRNDPTGSVANDPTTVGGPTSEGGTSDFAEKERLVSSSVRARAIDADTLADWHERSAIREFEGGQDRDEAEHAAAAELGLTVEAIREAILEQAHADWLAEQAAQAVPMPPPRFGPGGRGGYFSVRAVRGVLHD